MTPKPITIEFGACQNIIDRIEEHAIDEASKPGMTRERQVLTRYTRDVTVIYCRALRTNDETEIASAIEALAEGLAITICCSLKATAHDAFVEMFRKRLRDIEKMYADSKAAQEGKTP